jgi:hypothetical protein
MAAYGSEREREREREKRRRYTTCGAIIIRNIRFLLSLKGLEIWVQLNFIVISLEEIRHQCE